MFVLIPAVGPLVGALIGGSAGALGAALVSLGIPKDSVLKYETEIKTGRYLLLVHRTAADVETARGIVGI